MGLEIEITPVILNNKEEWYLSLCSKLHTC